MTVRRRMAVMAVALWLGVIVVGSGITWLVIGQVGRDVSAGAGPLTDVSVPQPSTAATVQPVPAQTSSPQQSGPPRSSAPRTPTPTPTTTRAPSRTTSTPPRTVPQKPPAPASGAQVSGSWFGSGGRVSASCVGSRITLGSASPADGWRVEVGGRGPEEVEVTFIRGGEDGSEVQVKARCGGDGPRFTTQGGD